MNLRGINYMTSVGSCSCLPKRNVLYNVTTDLSGGCLAFVTHACPKNFNYFIEDHKCYSYQAAKNIWSDSRKLCNNLLNSHPVVFDDPNENILIQKITSAGCKVLNFQL
ncbi:hypothetical protein HELRODRAFT_177795 [Helobdella robusta]|uniref:C-type lectin domain-containing protein n=1 Tax=Helobdella robusta TaxID=6412 RepID=T1FCA1_HELRO|nr:hypothetical protein HELRODRAFT_177795 [Helobdella robusta]ESN97735.1 hypothetical protein HELRODRAFT_177795 [Helobdella robusta]